MVSEVLVHVHPAPLFLRFMAKQKYGNRAKWEKAAHLLVARKQRERETQRETEKQRDRKPARHRVGKTETETEEEVKVEEEKENLVPGHCPRTCNVP